MPSGLPFSTSTTGPYHQAGVVKLITLMRSGLTWMFCAITSVRPDSSAGICDSQGIHSIVRFSTPSQSSTALLISTSMPLASLVLGSRIECGAITDSPSTMPSSRTRSSEPSAQFSNIGWVSWKNSSACEAAMPAPPNAAARPARAMIRQRMRQFVLCRPAPDRLTLSQMRVGLLLPAPRQARTRYFSTTAMSGSTPSPGSSGTRM